MKNQVGIKLSLLLLSFILVFSFLPIVSATIAQVTPLANTNQTANFVTNWTFANVTDGITSPTSANSTFYWNGTGVWVAVTKSGFVCDTVSCSATLTIASMGDGKGALNFTAGNASNNGSTLGTIGNIMRVDTTAPTVSVSWDKSKILVRNSAILTWSASDGGSGLSTVVMTLTSPDTADCATITSSSTSGTQTITADTSKCKGTYTGSVTATDIAGSSTTSSTTLTALETGGSVYIPEGGITTQEQQEAKKSNLKIFLIMGGAVFLILLLVLVLFLAGVFK